MPLAAGIQVHLRLELELRLATPSQAAAVAVGTAESLREQLQVQVRRNWPRRVFSETLRLALSESGSVTRHQWHYY